MGGSYGPSQAKGGHAAEIAPCGLHASAAISLPQKRNPPDQQLTQAGGTCWHMFETRLPTSSGTSLAPVAHQGGLKRLYPGVIVVVE